MDSFPKFRSGAGSFLCLRFFFLKYHRFPFSFELDHCNRKLGHFPFHSFSQICELSVDFITLESLLLQLVHSFFYLPCQRDKIALSVKLLKSFCNLKKSKNYFPRKIFIDKMFQYNKSSCYDKYH